MPRSAVWYLQALWLHFKYRDLTQHLPSMCHPLGLISSRKKEGRVEYGEGEETEGSQFPHAKARDLMQFL